MKKTIITILTFILIFNSLTACKAAKCLDPLERFPPSNTASISPDFSSIPGTIVISHSSASTKRYIGSPSVCIQPDGIYVASHDVFGPDMSKSPAETHIFSSKDEGLTWTKQATLDIQTGTLFYYNSALYLMGTRRGGVNCWMLKSTDAGKTWTEGVAYHGRYSMAPTPVLFAQGRIWRAVETGGRALMLSAPIGSDIQKSSSWTSTEGIAFPSELSCSIHKEWLEGNAVERVSDRKIVNILRVNGLVDDIAASVEVNGTKESFSKENFIRLPGASKKFTIRHDPLSGKYYSLVNWVPENMRDMVSVPSYTFPVERTRNTVAVATSFDLKSWKVEYIAIQAPNPSNQAFQYIDWVFDEDDIVFVSRTAWFDGNENAKNAHDSNFMTFHRIEKFRNPHRD